MTEPACKAVSTSGGIGSAGIQGLDDPRHNRNRLPDAAGLTPIVRRAAAERLGAGAGGASDEEVWKPEGGIKTQNG